MSDLYDKTCIEEVYKIESRNISENDKITIIQCDSKINKNSKLYQTIIKLLDFFIDQFNKQHTDRVSNVIKNYIKRSNINPVKIFHHLIQLQHHEPYFLYFSSMIGFFYQYGIGTFIDYQLAFKMYSISANQEIDLSKMNLNYYVMNNKFIGQISLGIMYTFGNGIQKDTKKAFRIFIKSAKEGSVKALSCIGFCFYTGNGVNKDERKAFKMDSKSAEKGDPVGQFNVGYDFREGVGIKKDENKSFTWYLKSAELGNIRAQHNIGYYYQEGIGISKNKKKAFEWYLRCANLDFDISQECIAKAYLKGKGIEKSEKQAFEWYLKSAENGNAFAQYKVGLCFGDGVGTKKDILKYLYWLNESKNNGDLCAEELLNNFIILLDHN
ncbi:hypothetical protein Glove_216g129 [Diversispora epigaea]|uniref:HCP-like protein n=1 Tax=Diversispora epigaea TaxID=1348612 RepID=A0A397ILW6_9GLOM|nr:hypothetical protein Glove_216g129 [Diversispora epigaea]